MPRSIAIIGAGIAGLAAGCYAQMHCYQSHICELHSLRFVPLIWHAGRRPFAHRSLEVKRRGATLPVEPPLALIHPRAQPGPPWAAQEPSGPRAIRRSHAESTAARP